ncbi:MAG: diacylglycerol kinase, partial [Actinomycetes bacterium]
MRLALIANPGSGKGLAPADLCRRLEELGADVVLCGEGWRGDEETRARAADAERLVVTGGDG